MRWLRTLLAIGSGGAAIPPAIAAGLPFEFVAVPGREAVAERERLLARGDITPVILGDATDVAPFVDQLGGREADVPGILHDAERLDLARWREARIARAPDLYVLPPAPWPTDEPARAELSVPLEVLTRRPKRTVLIGLLPTTRSWEAPAHLCYGGWNACPPVEVHVAMHRCWHQRWGTEIASMSSDVIECTVARPPQTREEALQLAREHLVYCPDIVHQGTQSVEGLAALLLGAGTWYFWWD